MQEIEVGRGQDAFDTNHMVTVIWDVTNLKRAEDELTAIIRTTLRADAKQTDNP